MIRRIEIIFHETAVWAKGTSYDVVPVGVPMAEGEVVFQRDYPRGTSIENIWKELRDSMVDYFFLVFYPSVVWQTRPPMTETFERIVTDNPDVALAGQSDYIRKRQTELPEFYMWNPRERKWHMTLRGYAERVDERDMTIGVSDVPYGYPDGAYWLEMMEERHKGETLRLILFVYPDRYDEEVRAMFEMRVTFWD